MAASGSGDLNENGGEVILDLQKFQIQPMDTLNTEHLQLLILTASPSASNQTVESVSSVPCLDSSQMALHSSEGAVAVVTEDTEMFIQGDNTSGTALSKTIQSTGGNLPKDSASGVDKQHRCAQCDKSFSGASSLSRHIKTHSNAKPFRCEPCNKVFSRLSSLKRHQGSHAEERPFKCTVCGWSFLQNSDLKIHERTHTGEKPFACDRCEQAFGCKKRLRAHYRKHTGEKPYKCPQCEKSFSMRKNVIQHLRIHTGERPFVCEVCKKRYRHQHTLKKHMQLHTVRCSSSTSDIGATDQAAVWPRKKKKSNAVKNKSDSDVSSRKKASDKSVHRPSEQTKDSPESNAQVLCSNSAETEKSVATPDLQNNTNTNENNTQDTCSKEPVLVPAVGASVEDHLIALSLPSNSSQRGDAETHENACPDSDENTAPIAAAGAAIVVEGLAALAATLSNGQGSSDGTVASENPFKCPHCDKCLSGASSLSRHIKTHTQEKPYKCVPCNKVFSRLSSLKRHQGSHAEERPFKCSVCGWTFLQNSDLKIHERTHTGEKPFACDRCDQSFGCKKRLRAHYRKHTGEKPYKCPQCEKSFSMKKNVIQHLRIHTGERPFTCWVCKKTYRHQHSLKKHIRLHADKNENLDQCIKKIKGKKPKSSDQNKEKDKMEVEVVVLQKDGDLIQDVMENDRRGEETEQSEIEKAMHGEHTGVESHTFSVRMETEEGEMRGNKQAEETEMKTGEMGKEKHAEETEIETLEEELEKHKHAEENTVEISAKEKYEQAGETKQREIEEDKQDEHTELAGVIEVGENKQFEEQEQMGDAHQREKTATVAEGDEQV